MKKKVLFLKIFFLSRTAKIDPKDGVSRLNFPEGFARAHKPNDASIRTSKKALMPLKPSKFQGPLEKPLKIRLQLSSKYL